MTQRDANASDFSRLLSLSMPRTDCPLTLARPTPSVAEAVPPLTVQQEAANDLEPLPEHGNLPGFASRQAAYHHDITVFASADGAIAVGRSRDHNVRHVSLANGAGMRTRSILSLRSRGSILSIGSHGSILSIGSSGSILSIGSVGSFASIGSAASALSLLSAFSFLSVMAMLSARSRRSLLAYRGQRESVHDLRRRSRVR